MITPFRLAFAEVAEAFSELVSASENPERISVAVKLNETVRENSIKNANTTEINFLTKSKHPLYL